MTTIIPALDVDRSFGNLSLSLSLSCSHAQGEVVVGGIFVA